MLVPGACSGGQIIDEDKQKAATGKCGAHLDDTNGRESMRELRTVLLRHHTPAGSHFDWLLDTPKAWRNPRSRVWTARTQTSAGDWADAGTWNLSRIADHRRHYLTYRGPLSGGRGTVDRVDEGWFVPQLWDDGQMILDLTMVQCRGRVRLWCLDDPSWRATWLG